LQRGLPEVRLLQFLLDVGGDQVNGNHVCLPAEASTHIDTFFPLYKERMDKDLVAKQMIGTKHNVRKADNPAAQQRELKG
jgi:hypothetical protein